MRPLKENILSDSMYSFRVNHSILPFLDSPWHFHADYELLYIINSTGKRIVGDSIENFYEGDMVFMGPGLPHVWKNGKEYYQNDIDYQAEAIVVQFKEDAFGKSFFSLPEMQSVKALFKISKSGLKISGKTHEKISTYLYDIVNLTGIERLCKLFQILDTLSKSADLIPLTTKSFEKVFYDSGSERINKVFEFVADNFKKDIELDEVANLANMNKSSFCRYFKKRSLKTFMEYLTEVRINYACKLLTEDRLNISEISHECGFNSHSYFNRQFKAIKKQTPKEYCKEHKLLIPAGL